jgi:hypothetical protein
MYAEDDLDEYQDNSEELYKSDIIQTILKESEKKEISHEEINEIINPNFAVL